MTTAVAVTNVTVLKVPVAVLDSLVKCRPDLVRDIGVELDQRRSLAETASTAMGLDAPEDSTVIA